jgi:SAM-dependent methyltransferase
VIAPERTGRDVHQDVRDILVCPLCSGQLDFHPQRLTCTRCAQIFVQGSAQWINLLPDVLPGADATKWASRQEACDSWYTELLRDPHGASECFKQDYGPHADFLRSVTGAVLDVGGGNGLVRQYLPRARRYVALEPSTTWLDASWAVLTRWFPCLTTAPLFVRGVGEYLPFRDGAFDAVLSFWSLNHVVAPDRVMASMARVLRPGGTLLLVLEDMPPRWRDVIGDIRRSRGAMAAASLGAMKIRYRLARREWPLQTDHIRIGEADVEGWAADRLERVRRSWLGGYLTYEFRRR